MGVSAKLLRAFGEGIAKRLGEHVADLVWAAVGLGGPVLAWLTSPGLHATAIAASDRSLRVLCPAGAGGLPLGLPCASGGGDVFTRLRSAIAICGE